MVLQTNMSMSLGLDFGSISTSGQTLPQKASSLPTKYLDDSRTFFRNHAAACCLHLEAIWSPLGSWRRAELSCYYSTQLSDITNQSHVTITSIQILIITDLRVLRFNQHAWEHDSSFLFPSRKWMWRAHRRLLEVIQADKKNPTTAG